jgi:SulP family sulfate permease
MGVIQIRRRLPQAWPRDALRVALGHDRFRQRAGDPHLHGATARADRRTGRLTYAMIAAGLAIIYLFPYVTKAVPSPLVAILVLTGAAVFSGLDLRTVGDLGELPSDAADLRAAAGAADLRDVADHLPLFHSACRRWPAGIAADGADRRRHDGYGQATRARNASDRVPAISPQPDRRHGRLRHDRPVSDQRHAPAAAGASPPSSPALFLLFLILVLDDLVRIIPMAALVAVMIMVSIGTFSWRSILDLRRNPLPSSSRDAGDGRHGGRCTHDLAQGRARRRAAVRRVLRRQGRQAVPRPPTLGADGTERTYRVDGQVFFASAESFTAAFDFTETLRKVTIDVTPAHLWDISAVAALDKVVLKYRRQGVGSTSSASTRRARTCSTASPPRQGACRLPCTGRSLNAKEPGE